MPKSSIQGDLWRNPARPDAAENRPAYKGLPIYALEGLHEHVSDLVRSHVPAAGRILELASGSGAMCARLMDMGYQAAAADYFSENFQLHDRVEFFQVDLNANFERVIDGLYDCVLAVELIEHLENPRAFLRSARDKCRRGGKIILTTPNVANPVSKAMYGRSGTFQWFTDAHYHAQGHITPIHPWQLRTIFAELDLQVRFEGTFGDPYGDTKRWRALWLLARFIELFSDQPASEKGEILVRVVEAG